MDLQLLLRHLASHAATSSRSTWSRITLDKMAAGGIYDHSAAASLATRSTSAGWCRTSRRCSTTTRCWPAAYLEALSGDRQRRLRPRRPRDARLRAARHDRRRRAASTAPRTPTAKAKKASSTSGRPTRSKRCSATKRATTFCYVYDVTDAGQLRGAQHPQPAEDARAVREDSRPRRGRAATRAGRSRAEAVRRAREARPSRARTTRCSSAWNGLMIDAMARAGGALGEPRYTGGRREGRRLHSRRTCGAPTAGCCTPGGTARPSSTPISTTTPAWPTRWSRSTKPRSTSAGSTKRCGWPTSCSTHFADAQDGGFFYTADDHEQLIARNKDLADAACPAATRWRRRRWCGSASSPATTKYCRRGERHAGGRGGVHAAGADGDGPDAAGARFSAWARRTSWSSRAIRPKMRRWPKCGGGICRTRCWPAQRRRSAAARCCAILLAGKTAAGRRADAVCVRRIHVPGAGERGGQAVASETASDWPEAR